ncbi:glycosyltransferase family 2 protein [Williamsia sp. MIQD14]|uniref:glycosyltransferase family 2 protein n=1 Tax=Williamsia sp. MIQD14 TaxID=3425703 RepID=UPI003DA1C705
MEPLTVMMPARNAETTVAAAIRSVTRGLPRDGRILVLDDASDDSTAEVVRGLARRDRRIGLLGSAGSRLGVAAAATALLDAVETPLVARMDADDISFPWRFRSQFALLDRHHLDCAFSPLIFVGPGRFAVEPQPLLSAGPESLGLELVLNCAVAHPTMTGYRAAILDVGGYRSVPSEDWDLWMRLSLNGARLGRTSLPALAYRRHSGQTSAQSEWKASLGRDTAIAEVHRDLCRAVLGEQSHRDHGAYAALAGPGAAPEQVAAAERLIDDVAAQASRFPLAQRLSLAVTAHGVRLLLRKRYPVSPSGISRTR